MTFQYRVVLNGLGYALFGVPERDLERMWRNGNTLGSTPGQLPLLGDPPIRHIVSIIYQTSADRNVNFVHSFIYCTYKTRQ